MLTQLFISLGIASAIAGVGCYIAAYRFVKPGVSSFAVFMKGSLQDLGHHTGPGRRLIIAMRVLMILGVLFFTLAFFVVGRFEAMSLNAGQ